MLTKTLSHDSIEGKRCLPTMANQSDITISTMTMKVTTNTGKNLKISRKCKKKVSKPFKP